MNFWKIVLLAWDFEPSIVIGCAALLAGYAWISRLHFTGRAACFISGVLVMFLALVSPIDSLSDDYLFSAHMLQHLLLSQVVPPLLLLGIPAPWWEWLLRSKPLAASEKFLRQPLVAWTIGIAALWIWHWPRLFDLALQNENVHIVQHLCFMVTGCLFWWPVVTPLANHRLTAFTAVFFLFAACTVSSLLGIFITFSSSELYPYYASSDDPLGILSTLRAHLSLHEDQQLGGLMMWVPCCLIYATAILATLGNWQDAAGESSEVPGDQIPAGA
jgi:putative membrane protein